VGTLSSRRLVAVAGGYNSQDVFHQHATLRHFYGALGNDPAHARIGRPGQSTARFSSLSHVSSPAATKISIFSGAKAVQTPKKKPSSAGTIATASVRPIGSTEPAQHAKPILGVERGNCGAVTWQERC
jgi:hypothetical protein